MLNFSDPPVAVVDALNSLLEAEENSIFRFMEEGSPYLSRAAADVRRPLHEMVAGSYRRAGELSELIQSLGGEPAPRAIRPEEQYLAFLSLKFLLPKLVEAKKLAIRRCQNAILALNGASPAVTAMLDRHLAEHRQQLAVLEKTTADVMAK